MIPMPTRVRHLPMARRSNRSWSSFAIKSGLLVALFCALSYGLTFVPIIAGQNRKSKPQPKPSSTPATSNLKRIGAPPPAPVLRKKTEEEIKPGDVISVETSEVMLPVTVRDRSGRFVSDLTRKDFHVFEDNREQPLSDLALRQVPVDVILMVDASSSVAAKLDDFRRAAEQLADKLDPNDRISLIKVDDRVQLLQDWTRIRYQLLRALTGIEVGMFTRFNDALVLAARDQFGTTQSRRAIIVLSDGVDSGRGTTSAEALQAILMAQVTVYVISNTEISRATKRAQLDSLTASDADARFNQLRIDDLREGLHVLDESEQRLAELATASGGRLYKPESFNQLGEAYRQVADELRRQYALYYTPLNKARDGSFRRVHVETSDPTFTTATRVGYYAPRG